jgi:FAD:protein FMN transferase
MPSLSRSDILSDYDLKLELKQQGEGWAVEFKAMASPCEVLFDSTESTQVQWLGELAQSEALRIESAFSRYTQNNTIHKINNSNGKPVEVDAETAGLLDFSHQLYELSQGRFDITSGVLRRLWKFDGSANVPSRKQAKALLPLIGWQNVRWEKPVITVPEGMEIDLGGLGKEYAVDRVATLLATRTKAAFLVNFGGDLRAVGDRLDGKPWDVGVERPGFENQAHLQLQLSQGALATSGDANRFLLKDGLRYPHILNPRTAWPVMNAPRSVTVLADTCTEAGLLATLAMLKGNDAESFMAEQGGKYWILR